MAEQLAVSPHVRMLHGTSDPATYIQPRWYAAHTCANHERKVVDHLESRGVEHFLPQYESVRKWKDRKVLLRLPLFPGYVFVRLSLQDRLKVLQVPGVACLVSFGGRPVPMPEDEFLKLRGFLAEGFHAEPHPYLRIGRRVRIKSGPLAGLEGIVARKKRGERLVLSVDLLMRSIIVDVDMADIDWSAVL